MDKEEITGLVTKGREAVNQGKFQEGEDYLKKAIELESDPKMVKMYHTFLAECYLRQGRKEEGIEALVSASNAPEKSREILKDLSTTEIIKFASEKSQLQE